MSFARLPRHDVNPLESGVRACFFVFAVGVLFPCGLRSLLDAATVHLLPARSRRPARPMVGQKTQVPMRRRVSWTHSFPTNAALCFRPEQTTHALLRAARETRRIQQGICPGYVDETVAIAKMPIVPKRAPNSFVKSRFARIAPKLIQFAHTSVPTRAAR